MSRPRSSSARNILIRSIPDLRRPLVLAVRHGFASPEAMSGAGRRMLRLIKPIIEQKHPKAISERIERIRRNMIDFEHANAEQRRSRVFKALAALDSLQNMLLDPPKYEKSVETNRHHPLEMSAQELKGVGPSVAQKLAAKNLITVADVMNFLPRRWEDRRKVGSIAELIVGEFGQSTGTIAAMGQSGGFGKSPYEVIIQDESGNCGLTWFHYGGRSIPKRFKVGDRVRFGGKVNLFRGRKQIVHPDIEKMAETESFLPEFPILPVYPEIQGINGKKLNSIIGDAIDRFGCFIEDPLPDGLLKQLELPKLSQALISLHRPEESADVNILNECDTSAHARLAFDEFFFVQLALARIRHGRSKLPGFAHKRLNRLATRFYHSFPYKLTNAQRRVLSEIVDDLTTHKPMNRLLQGDVGSGKTIVALLSALLVVENDRQTALMAPTEILAEQHYKTISAFCDLDDLKVCLLTSDTPAALKRKMYQEIADGDMDIVVGTHALIQDAVEFANLGYAIIDEQHRFGVRQRAELRTKGGNPDCLVMTATPIPRSLALTVYGDLDVSVLDELPPGRQPIDTQVLWMSEEKKMLRVLLQALDEGRQAYVITPLVSESEKMDLADAESEHVSLQEKLTEQSIGLLHGRMNAQTKESVMRNFRDGVYSILVATTVVEVGVDVPNATVMVVRHAERFGLSQLHQLRGRIGRGEHPSTCILMCEKVGEEARERLAIMEETTDGFLVAEKDLEIRGPGDFLGTRQVGVPLFRHASLMRDQLLLQKARKYAFDIIEKDPNLQLPEHVKLKTELAENWVDRLTLIGIG